MPLRFKTLLLAPPHRLLYRKALFFMLAVICSLVTYSQSVSNEQLKKDALKLFEEEDYVQAYKLYSQLVSNFPKDPDYNFRLGVCMIYSEPDKKKCLPYLKFAYSKPEESPKETKFYLGKAYHINYLFDEAIKYYNEYKKAGSSSQQKKLQVDREIKACAYGKRLLSNLSDLVVINKKQLNEADYFRSYDLKGIGGKLLAKPDDFKTNTDKKKKDKSIVYLPSAGAKVYFSSYGEDDNRDIYYATKLPNGTFSKAQKVTGINSDQDEDYPFLHPDGNTIYFASKGFNGMGGYDIFKSTYIESTNSWSQPVNLEFPINSPDDDYLYVTDSLEKTAWFSTGRQSLPGKIDVLKISTERKPIDVLALKGTVVKESADQSIKSKITVKNMDNGNIVGIFTAQDNGDYLMDLPNGANLLYTVETPGLKTQSERVGLPMAATSKPLKQTISYDKGILKIINYFDESASDDSYVQYLKLIEQKAKLDVNQGKNNLTAALLNNQGADPKNNSGNNNNTNGSGIDTSSANTAANTATKTSEPNKTGLNNKQLADMANKESQELAKEASQLNQDAADAIQLAEEKKIEADKKLKEADDAFKNSELITNAEEKKAVVEKTMAIKKEAEADQLAAAKILEYANSLKEDAANKTKEAELNKQYSDELTKITANKNNSQENLDKLDDIQKQIDAIGDTKSKSDEVYTTIKNAADENEKEIAKYENINEDIKTSISEIKEAISSTEEDLAKAKRKEKEALNTKITELKAEQEDKEKQIASNETEIKKLKEESVALNKSADIANKVKTENVAIVVNTTAVTSATNAAEPVASEKITNKELADKYKDKIAITDNTDKTSIEQSSLELKNYNTDIDSQLAKNKQELTKTTNQATKQQLNNEIKQLETTKKQNQQKIAANTKKIDDLNKASVANNAKSTNTSSITPIVSTDNNDAIKKLDNLNSNLTYYDNANFDYNAYQNNQAQQLKVEADAKINEAIASEKKLKDLIAATKNNLQSNTGSSSQYTATPQQLYKEAEDLNVKAFDLKMQANTKTGAEKDALLVKAKEEETKGNEKSLEAAKIIESDNKAVYSTEKDNLQKLISANKAPENEITEAKKLSDEASLAYKQALTIREEANSLTNSGAKLGNLSNAEEKEAEAIAKQKQAVDLLKTSSPDITLNKATTSETFANTGNNANNSSTLDSQLSEVNKSIAELQTSKTDAYQKLYDANKMELDQLTNDLKNSKAVIDKTPALKTEFISANNKINSAQNLKQTSEASADNNKKTNDLVLATKKQIEALNQLNNLSKKMNASAANNVATNNTDNTNSTNTNNTNANNAVNTKTATANNDNISNNNTAVTTTVASTNDNATARTNTTTTDNSNNNNANNTTNNEVVNTTTPTNTNAAITTTTGNSTVAITNTVAANNNDNTTNNAATSATVDVKELSAKDTSAAELVTLLENKNVKLNNQQANALINKSINELKNLENESKAIDNEIKNAGQGTVSENPEQLKVKSDNLLMEAEDLNVKAFDLKTVANTKSGGEKDSLLLIVKDLDERSESKKLEAVKLTEQSNRLSYSANNNAITELKEKLKTDNPDLSAQLEEKINEINTLKVKSQQLRDEANSQTNNNAKIGSLMNAEEKEAELLQKQNEVLSEMKKQYPDYAVKTSSSNENSSAVPEELKQKQNQVREKQYSGLTNLTNGYSLEYETSKNKVPANLTDDQKIIKQNADDLNAESKRLLIQSASEKNPAEKTKLLTLSAKTGNAAVDQLNKLPKTNTAVATNNNTANNNTGNNNGNANNATVGNNTATNNNASNNTPGNNTNNANNTAGRGTVKIEGLEVVAGNAYNAAKPIPLDVKVPDGLIFRVQIGAFKSKLPDNSFRGLSPLNAETTPNGYIRYTAGNFNRLENANAVKNDLKNLGYSDAFVVVFYNGKRISLNEAMEILAKEGKPLDTSAPLSAGITANSNIPKATATNVNPNLNNADVVTVTKELEQTNGLLYTVQIGVYNKQVNKGKLFNLRPVYSEKLPNGLYRYTAGIYNNPDKLITDKGKVVTLGIKDAFVSAYLNGKKIPFADGKIKQQDTSTKMEPENPIIFSDVIIPAANTPVNNTVITNTNPTNVQPFTNGITSYPPATAENGVKANEEGISFKVQIGAYSKQIPNDVAAKFSSIKTWPVENKPINGLFIYNIGNFTEAKFAKTLKEEAVRAGIIDAFVTVYKDGKKLYGNDAAQYLNR